MARTIGSDEVRHDLTDWRGTAILTPRAFLATRVMDGDVTLPLPDACVMVFSRRIFDALLARHGGGTAGCSGLTSRLELGRIGDGESCASVVLGSYGAPAAVMALEMAIELGSRRIIVLGSAGSLEDRRWGDAILVDRALRGEGTSDHYLAPAADTTASPELIESLRRAGRDAGLDLPTGTVWTTDALFRETADSIAAARRLGATCVDMEAAALYAAGRALGVEVAALLFVTDVVDTGWRPLRKSEGVGDVPAPLLLTAAAAAMNEGARRGRGG